LVIGFDFSKAVLCDMMENEIETLETHGRSVIVPVSIFEIMTIKLSN